MILEVKQFPESQEVMDKPEWFFICDGEEEVGIIGDSAYARVLNESEYVLKKKTNKGKRMNDAIVTIKLTEHEFNIIRNTLNCILQAKELSTNNDVNKLKEDLDKIKDWIKHEKEKAKKEH